MAEEFDEKDMAEALDTHRMVADTGMFDLDDPQDQEILSKVGALGAAVVRDPENKPKDVNSFVEDGAPLVDKLTRKEPPSKGE